MNRVLVAVINGGLLSAFVTTSCWLLLRAVPRRMLNAATRYVLWWAMLLMAAAMPAIYLFPSRSAPLPSRPAVSRTEPTAQQSLPIPIRIVPPVTAEPVPTPHIEAPRLHFPIEIATTEWPRWILVGWLLTSMVLLIRVQASYFLLARASHRAWDAPAPLNARVARWMRTCGSSRQVRLAESPEIAAPVAVGPRHPSILVPANMLDTLAEAELEQIGLHEAAHLARIDDYALIVQRIIESLFAFHPVIRWITRQIDLEREIACDDLVIAATGRAREYAACLTRVAELSGRRRPALAAAPAADDRSHLARRIDMLLDRTRHTGTRLLKARLSAMVAGAAILVWLGGRTPAVVAFATPLVRQVALAAPQSLRLPALMPQAAVPPASAAADFEAHVVEDSSGTPLASAEVRFHKTGQRELAADLDTDSAGRLRATGLPPGEYTVEISKPNYVTASVKARVPSAEVFVRLVRYAIFSGQVTDQQGKPAPGRISAPGGRAVGGARITMLSKSSGSAGFTPAREQELDEVGRFRFYDLPPGEYAVGLWYDGLKEGSGVNLYPNNANPRIFTVEGGEDLHDLNFQIAPRPVFQVSGKVQLPKPKTTFALALGLPDQPLLPIAQTLTRDDGSFRFERVPAGTYDLFAAGPDQGYGAHTSLLGPDPFYGRTRVNVTGGDVTGLDLPVAPGRSVTVKLGARGGDKLPEGCPQNTTVRAALLEPWGVANAGSAQVSFGKEQTFRNLAPGRVRLDVNDLGPACYQAEAPIVDLSGDQAGTIVIELASAGTVRGVLHSGSASASGFTIVLLESDAGTTAEAHLASPDTGGHFSFEGLRPGRYRVAAQPAAAGPKGRWVADFARMKEIQVEGGKPAEVELSAAPPGGRP